MGAVGCPVRGVFWPPPAYHELGVSGQCAGRNLASGSWCPVRQIRPEAKPDTQAWRLVLIGTLPTFWSSVGGTLLETPANGYCGERMGIGDSQSSPIPATTSHKAPGKPLHLCRGGEETQFTGL